MAASNFTNLSFEAPGGSAATLLSANSEPFNFVAGQTLEIQVSGGSAQIVAMNPVDFADIANATAAEVVLVIDQQTLGIATTVSAGQVRMDTRTEGAESSLLVLGGGANTSLQFPLSLASGATRLGYATGWSVATVSSVWSYGEFANAFAEPFDSFEYGWLNNQDFLFTLDGNLTVGLFAPYGEQYESYEDGWGATGLDLGLIVAAVTTDTVPTAFESFEGQWPQFPIPPGNDASTFISSLVTINEGQFNPVTGPTTFDSFETEWRDNQNFKTAFVGSPTDLDNSQFRTPGFFPVFSSVETFGDDGYDPYQYVVTFTNNTPPAGTYRLNIVIEGEGTFVFEETTGGATSGDAIVTAFSNAINNSGLALVANAVIGVGTPIVQFRRTNFSEGIAVQVDVDGANYTELVARRAAADPYTVGTWTGESTLET